MNRTFKSKKVSTKKILEIISDLHDKIISIRGTIDKQNKLKELYDKNPNVIGDVLYFIYNDKIQFNLTPPNIKKFRKNKKYDSVEYNKYTHLYDLLIDLDSRKITGHLALKSTSEFIKKYEEYENIIFMILKKNLETRLSTKSINKILGNIIPEFKVVLANKFNEKYMKKHEKDDWYITRKYDGVRIISYVDTEKETIRYYSRIGKENDKLDFITKTMDFKKLRKNGAPKNFVLDGEIIHIDDDSVEDFKKIMELIKNPERDQSKLCYVIFDILTVKEFEDSKSKRKLSTRMEELKKVFKNGNGKFSPIKQTLNNDKNFKSMSEKMEKGKWEGLMLRRDTIYEGKRTNDLLKVKKFEDDEFKVIGIIPSEIRYIDKETKKDSKMTALGSIIIDYNDVRVGSGFTEEERIYYYNNPNEIIGKVVTVQYFEKTPDNKLRFPTLKFIHGKKRTT